MKGLMDEGKMEKTWFKYADVNIEITRPVGIQSQDKHIGNRCYELLKKIKKEDDWTKEIDLLIKNNNITFKQVSDKEIEKIMMKSNNMTIRGVIK